MRDRPFWLPLLLLVPLPVVLSIFALMAVFVMFFVSESSAPPAEPAAAVAPAVTNNVVSDVVIGAYQQAAVLVPTLQQGCVVPWWLLFGIGQVEWTNGLGNSVTGDGEIVHPVIGIPLDGRPGVALIAATPEGILWDGDPLYDHAIGPMQVLPHNWKVLGVRAAGDGRPADPQNINDAALTAAVMLCRSGGGDLTQRDLRLRAEYGYNPDSSGAYSLAVEKALAPYCACQQ